MNVPSIKHVFSTTPGKSRVRILQSIGRALRLHKSKDEAVFWDFTDRMEIAGKVNIGFSHLEERMRLYITERFKLKLYEVKL
jgi:superfamily II DNA or RNA helicase